MGGEGTPPNKPGNPVLREAYKIVSEGKDYHQDMQQKQDLEQSGVGDSHHGVGAAELALEEQGPCRCCHSELDGERFPRCMRCLQ